MLRLRRGFAMSGLLLAGCMANPPVAVHTPPPAAPGHMHTVIRGENLYRIALQYGLDYRDIAAWNGIAEPYLIHPGDRLVLRTPGTRRTPPPGADTRAPTTLATPPAAPPPVPLPPPEPPRSPPGPAQAGRTTAPPPPAMAPPSARAAPRLGAPGRPGAWQWPARGRAVRGYSEAHGGNKGVDIAATPGEPVWAARDGTVVYVGDGLKQYGNLVIVRHDAEYLSAYGHLGAALVTEGASVRAGEPIAYVGGPAEQGLLHFEIRRRGEPVNPAGVIGVALSP
jgi:lipoprotein NlpD